MHHLESAGIVVFTIQKDGVKYLLLHYPHGHWDFAKGKVEPGETQQETALRELKEETGLEAEIIPGFLEAFSYIYTEKDGQLATKKVSFFLGQTFSDEVALSYEHDGYAWLS